MHYLVDGYNLLFQYTEEGLSLEHRRGQIITEINLLLSTPLPISLIFDNIKEKRDYPTRFDKGGIEIIYTPFGQSADHYIIDILKCARSPQQYTVVTDDRGLALNCQSLHAKTQNLAKFLLWLDKRNRKHGSSSQKF